MNTYNALGQGLIVENGLIVAPGDEMCHEFGKIATWARLEWLWCPYKNPQWGVSLDWVHMYEY